MPLVGFVMNGQQLSFAESLAKAQRGETEYGYPVLAAMIKAITGKGRPPPRAGVSASQFQGCMRKLALEPLVEYYDTPQSQYWMVRGTWTHATIEGAVSSLDPTERALYRQEERLFAQLEMEAPDGEPFSFPIHGQYDLLYRPPTDEEIFAAPSLAELPSYPILYDHKTTKFAPTAKAGIKRDHLWQASIYRWLLERNGYAPLPDELRINYMDPAGVIQFRSPLIDGETVEHYMRYKLSTLVASRRLGTLPPRVALEGQWQCGNNAKGTSYCPFTAHCWPQGFGPDAPDGLVDFRVAREGDSDDTA